MRRTLALCLILLAPMATAEPRHYGLQPEASSVGFETDFGPDKITGRMPVTQADLTLDFQNLGHCKVDVTLDVAAADASFPFAAQAMKGPKVLDARSFPTITFHSTDVAAEGSGAVVKGMITIRGVTRPALFHATIYRQQGSDPADLSHLTVLLKGEVLRSDFGATGWADMVGDVVRLDITARIARLD